MRKLLTRYYLNIAIMNYSTISLEYWKQVGEGGNGATYIHVSEPDVMLKVNNLDGTEEAMSKEFCASKAVHDLGIATPEMKQLVRVGNGYGIVSQLIKNKKSIARMCNEAPEQIDALARQMAEQTRQLHATIVLSSSCLPSMKGLMLEALEQTSMLSGKKLQDVIEYVKNLPDAQTLLHGDLQMGNIISGGQDKPSYYWIDLGRAVHGIPMFDLGHFYLFCNIFSKKERVQLIAHMTEKQMVDFWNAFALAYNGPEHLDEFTAECKRFAALDVVMLGHVQKLTWSERFFLGLLAKSLFKVGQ